MTNLLYLSEIRFTFYGSRKIEMPESLLSFQYIHFFCQLLISADTPSYPFPQETENVIVKMYYVHMERSLHSLLS